MQMFFGHACNMQTKEKSEGNYKSNAGQPFAVTETCFVWFCLRSWIWSLGLYFSLTLALAHMCFFSDLLPLSVSINYSGAVDWQWERFVLALNWKTGEGRVGWQKHHEAEQNWGGLPFLHSFLWTESWELNRWGNICVRNFSSELQYKN